MREICCSEYIHSKRRWFGGAVWLHTQPLKQPLNVQKVTDHLWVIMNAASETS
jgi:hypothetical protein